MSLTNTGLLLKSFKETVESGIELGDIEGIDDETLDKLLEFLRTAISTASKSDQKPRTMLRSSLDPDLQPEVFDSRARFRAWSPSSLSETQFDQVSKRNLPMETQQAMLQPPAAQKQAPMMYVPAQTTAATSMAQTPEWMSYGMQIPSGIQSTSHPPEPGNVFTDMPFIHGNDLSGGGWDQWDPFWQNSSMVSLNSGTSMVRTQFPNGGQTTTEFDFGV
jgi:hypothetical protein